MPKNKVSALRGGMGEMLLQMNCIRDRNCEVCDFKLECMVQRTMYSRYEKNPVFLTSGESIGYVLECENYQETFAAGEELDFQLILFGKTLVYFNQFMQAFTMLGVIGLGKHHAKFRIVSVKNQQRENIVDEESLDLSNYRIQTLSSYVEHRLRRLSDREQQNRLIFYTPVTIKYQNEYMQEFQLQPLLESLKRRVYMLACFEGIEADLRDFTPPLPNILQQKHEFTTVRRYSNRKDTHMELKGIRGFVQTDGLEGDFLELLLAGEIMHIGKNTSFGFGKYVVR